MLVIVSDLHLADGTTGMRTPAGAFELFRERLEDMAYNASQRGDGTYQPIESFDLLLLGDILDPLSSTQWTDEEKGEPGYARPWSRPDDPAFVNKVGKITEKIIQENAESLGILCRIAQGDEISLPPATKNQQPDLRVSRDSRSAERLPVKVRIYYMIGNHDWFYHLPGPGLDQIRKKITSAMGLSNEASPFPYEASESELVINILKQHSVFARHGDYYDPYNLFKKDRDHASLSDAVCVELMKRIGVLIRSEFLGKLPDGFFRDLDEMGSIRPELMTPVWIASLLDRYQATRAQRKKIDSIWHDLVEQFSKLDFLDELNQPFKFDLVDAVKTALMFARLVSIDKLDDWALAIDKLERLMGLGGKANVSYAKYAVQEDSYKSREARFIVYGHTHQFAVTPLRATSKNGLPFDQMYLNAGTWLPVHETCDADSNKKGFMFHKTMGYLGIYQGDERRDKAYETWSGILDI
jgi:UDP-2,3-diacylglucosamine pyrophosphatase LpxH